MSWRDHLRPASFRGAGFHVDADEFAGGRKAVKHEYPQRDFAYVEDLGRKGRSFPIDGYVIGPDYLGPLNALISALEGEGPGTLVHPYHGERTVAVTGFRVRHTRDEGGMARISIDFEETSEAGLFPSISGSLVSAVRSAAGSSLLSVASSFVAGYVTDDVPQFALDSLMTMIGDAGETARGSFAPIMGDAQHLAGLNRAVDSLVSDPVSIVRDPADISRRLSTVFLAGLEGMTSARAGIDALLDVSEFVSTARPAPSTTSTRRREATNQAELDAVVRRQAIIRAAQAAPLAAFDNYQEAMSVRDRILVALDDHSEVAPDEVWQTMQQLRAAVVEAVPGSDRRLPHLLRHRPAVTVPSLVLAYELYDIEDLVSRETDIIRRNRLRKPGFTVGGAELEVLSRA
ncbi:DNA circularization N-terminal domain-containing protein [Kaustia mangrovi]|uniref:DNA circularization N-terminal domain-containing protein n=1 Tax=Kaustia mangrovi TaxID=2593653 RepID=A0A7S8HD10_9HYPH|nr:DNA circularization N-terminal domain-containing protein [Kaustia mangrovi]QPC44009.1 DNA circularization N-terminal domain-containing protein [Kaustia mangrovi]